MHAMGIYCSIIEIHFPSKTIFWFLFHLPEPQVQPKRETERGEMETEKLSPQLKSLQKVLPRFAMHIHFEKLPFHSEEIVLQVYE